MNALLLLEDGFNLFGKVFAGSGEVFGEVVFNTGMNGYQEAVTDPSSHGQLLCFTYPHIGNYGCRPADNESAKPAVNAVITKHYCREPQSLEARESLADMLNRHNTIGLEEIDTRTLTLHLREKGAMRGVISTEVLNPEKLQKKLNDYCRTTIDEPHKEIFAGTPFIWRQTDKEISVISPTDASADEKDVTVIDFGVTYSILKALYDRGCRITVVAPYTSFEEIKELNPRGIFLGSGPGSPLIYKEILPVLRRLIGWKPLMAVGMGQLLLGMALGMDSYKMPFGHRGVNQPVKEQSTGRVLITKQNHGYNLQATGKMPEGTVVSHINLNDNTIEGIANESLGCFSAQFYPDTGFGPHHIKNLYEYFTEII